jgi:exonuclease III
MNGRMRLLRVITWNVAGRVRRQPEQAELLARADADVVALQEVTTRTLPLWRASFAAAGFAACECALDDAPTRTGRRLLGVLTAAREPLRRIRPPVDVPWPERVLCCVATDVEVVNLHSPIAPAPGLAKVRTHEAIAAYLGARDDRPVVLCGDLNTPRRETPDGAVVSFARDGRGRLRPERGPAWDEAELGVVPGLRDLGFRDAFRALHGYAAREPSWTWRRIAGHGGGWRLDHVFCSAELRPAACAYHHGWRDDGLSDHSALEADLER